MASDMTGRHGLPAPLPRSLPLSLPLWVLALWLAAFLPMRSAEAGAVKVEVVKNEAGYGLLRGGKPFEVRGAGMARDDIARFAARGGNAIRNWTTNDQPTDILALLDAAHEHGVAVALGLPMKSERHGFDYDDEAAVAAQLAAMREDVQRFRDHPALLAWIIGNELNHSYSNPRVWNAVNDVARMIHELDPNHPATTALAGAAAPVIAEVTARAPELDFLSFQVYGTLFALPELLDEAGYDGAFMVTEWGTIGYWEMEKTPWGAPVELTSSEKADVYRRGWREILAPLRGRLIGDFAFVWGQKQERTPSWFGLITDRGEVTEAVDVLQEKWTGAPPANRTPRVESATLDGRGAREAVSLRPGATYRAEFVVTDADGDDLAYRWELRPESEATQSGGDYERPIDTIDGLLSDPNAAAPLLTAPPPGRYRLFAYAVDDHGQAAHANIPFLVEDGAVP